VTPITKPVKRRTIGPHRGLRVVVSLEPGDVIGFRSERTRRTYYVTVGACFDMAVRQQVAAERAAKRKGKK